MNNSSPYVIALYMRLSVKGIRVDSMSIENQRNSLLKFVDSMEDVRNAQILEFADDGYSGTNFERPAVQRLLEMVQEGKINCVIVKDFTRFGRNSLEVGYYMERVFPAYRVRFISVNDSYDSGTMAGDTGGVNVAFKYLMGEFYSRDLSVKTRTAKYVRMRRGEYQSVICPYGYRKSADGRMEPDEETAPVVRLIFELAAKGLNSQQISNALFDREIPTPGEYKAAKKQTRYDVSRTHGVWEITTVLRVLRDECYTGTYVMGKRRVTEIGGHHVQMKDESEWFRIPDHHPAIVSRELYEKANANIRRQKITKRVVHKYPLKRKAFCGCCRHALERMDTKNRYLYCSHSGLHDTEPCFRLGILESDLETKVYEAIVSRLREMERQDDSAPENQERDGTEEQAAYEARIAERKSQKRQLYERYAMREITLDEYKMRKAVLDREMETLESVYSILCAKAEKKRSDESVKNTVQKLLEDVRNADALTSALSDALIERVYLYPDNHVEIDWKPENFKAARPE